MDNQTQQTTSGGSSKFVLPVVIAALIVFAAVGFYLYQQNSASSAASIAPAASSAPQAMEATETAATDSAYKNGTYSVTGEYLSPGGQRTIDVELTLIDGNITEIEVTPTATDATSQRFQGEFAEGYKPMVMGKSIDEIELTKVSGSSLTPKGFQDALEKIKAEAKA